MHLTDPKNGRITEVAFRDARRLGRVRLCSSPHDEPPISELGFDPLLSMPTFSEFSTLLQKRRGIAVKALLLDQTFSAGVGNWIAGANFYIRCFIISVTEAPYFSRRSIISCANTSGTKVQHTFARAAAGFAREDYICMRNGDLGER